MTKARPDRWEGVSEAERAERIAANNARNIANIEAEYKLNGMKPVYAGDMVVSMSLLNSLKRSPFYRDPSLRTADDMKDIGGEETAQQAPSTSGLL